MTPKSSSVHGLTCNTIYFELDFGVFGFVLLEKYLPSSVVKLFSSKVIEETFPFFDLFLTDETKKTSSCRPATVVNGYVIAISQYFWTFHFRSFILNFWTFESPWD